MKFAYKGISRDRQEIEGVVEAEDSVEAKMKLRSMQVRPISIKVLQGGSNKPAPFGLDELKNFDLEKINEISFGPIIDLKGLLIFIRQFSSLIDAGVPVVQGLSVLAEQNRNKQFQKILNKVREQIESGSTLATAMGQHPKAFPEIMVCLIEAGEVSGTLDLTLRRIGVQLEKTDILRRKVKGAMMYPAITLVFSVIVLLFLLLKVIPDVAQMYTDSNAELPGITTMVLELSDWLTLIYQLIFFSIGAFFVGVPFLYRSEVFRTYWDPLLLKLPFFGPLVQRTTIARVARTLSVLVGSGVPLLNAFQIVTKLVTNRSIKKVIDDTAAYVTEGKSVAFGFSQRGLFPPMVVQMVSIGEMSGRLDELMGKVADMYEDEVDETVDTISSLLQPILIAVVGGIILFLLVAMYLPIFQLADKVGGG